MAGVNFSIMYLDGRRFYSDFLAASQNVSSSGEVDNDGIPSVQAVCRPLVESPSLESQNVGGNLLSDEPRSTQTASCLGQDRMTRDVTSAFITAISNLKKGLDFHGIPCKFRLKLRF